MSELKKKITIIAPRAKVWEKIADLGAVQNYNPLVKKSYYNTDIKNNAGAGRVCEFSNSGVVNEVAIDWEEGKRYVLHITPVKNIPFFKEGNAEFILSGSLPYETDVTVNFNYTVSGGVIGQMMNALAINRSFHKAFEGVLLGLKKHLEVGDIISNYSSLKNYHVSVLSE